MVIGKARSSEIVAGALKQGYDCVYPTIVLRMVSRSDVVSNTESERKGGRVVNWYIHHS